MMPKADKPEYLIAKNGEPSEKAAAAGPPTPSELKTAPPGVGLGFSIDRLIYFNGRFLKAEDLRLEQEGALLRAALAERAQGAGVSYGYHVTVGKKPVDPDYVKDVAAQLYEKMQKDREGWGEIIKKAFVVEDKLGTKRDEYIKRLAGTLGDLCGGGGGATTDGALTIGPGHAADGYGHDLYLPAAKQVKLQALFKAFQASPTRCAKPGPSITPEPIVSGLPSTGAFLLCVYLDFKDDGQVPVYGVQCDAKDTACSLGYHKEGVGVQLVFFDALGTKSIADRSDPIQWRGAGARRYFEAEGAARPSQLSSMTRSMPFSGGADAPDTGTHVPIGVVYLDGGSFVGFDEWTAKRLREPAETSYWLRSLVHASRPARLARVLQFQAQLTEALAASNKAQLSSLWQLGFAEGAQLVLPGVGFLPVEARERRLYGNTGIGEKELRGALDVYFAGVPYRLQAATSGAIEAAFVGALESGELRLRRSKWSYFSYEKDLAAQLEEQLLATQKAALVYDAKAEAAASYGDAEKMRILAQQGAERTEELERLRVATTNAPAVLVWYTPDDFPGWVMFTWPDLAAGARPGVCLCTDASPGKYITQTFRDGEWAGFPLLPLAAFRLRLDAMNPGLTLRYEGVDDKGATVAPDSEGWVGSLVPSTGRLKSLTGLRVWLTGPASDEYDVRYTGRFILGQYGGLAIDGPTAENGALCSVQDYIKNVLGKFTAVGDKLEAALLQAIQVRVVPKGCATSDAPVKVTKEKSAEGDMHGVVVLSKPVEPNK